MAFSQSSEEGVILNYFKDRNHGNLLDIGAYCAEVMSNTRQLLLNGWQGTLIEPSPKPFQNLLDVYRDNLSVKLINAAITPNPVSSLLVEWYDSNGDAVSTMSTQHRDLWSNDVKYRMYYIPVVHINAVYSAIGNTQFNFINLDVEGMNFAILQTLDLTNCELICVEFENNKVEILNYLRVQGFSKLHENSENLIMGK